MCVQGEGLRKQCWPCFPERRASVHCPGTFPRVCRPSSPPRLLRVGNRKQKSRRRMNQCVYPTNPIIVTIIVITEHEQRLLGGLSHLVLVRPTEVHQLVDALFGLEGHGVGTQRSARRGRATRRRRAAGRGGCVRTLRQAKALHPHTLASTSSSSSSSKQPTRA